MRKDLKKFEENIGYTFSDKNLLKQAFVHRSYINENRSEKLEHNERIEFLGDAVLELIVTDHLFTTYPKKSEGELTALRSALVKTQALALAAGELNMNDFLFLSKGENRDTGRARQYILADTFEAFIGALYLDQGLDKATEFVAQTIIPRLEQVLRDRLWQDAKSDFQEKAQNKVGITPRYRTLKETGPDHDKQFVIAVYLDDKKVAEGEGRSKQEAEQDAAEKALVFNGW